MFGEFTRDGKMGPWVVVKRKTDWERLRKINAFVS